jgi:hypothetical protein
MEGSGLEGASVASMLAQALLEGEFLGIDRLYLLILVIALLSVIGLSAWAVRRRRRKRRVNELLKRQRAMEGSTKELLTTRKADAVKSVGDDVGKPKTIIPDGLVAYSESGEMLVFGSTKATEDSDVVAAALEGKSKALEQPLPTWSPSYRIERIVVMHMTGVVMFSVDEYGRIHKGDDIEPDLLIVLEGLLEDAKWFKGEMVSTVYRDRSVCLTWGNLLHLAAVVDGEPDERLDRELRWAIGDLSDEYADEVWFWGEEVTDFSVWQRLSSRVKEVLVFTKDVDLALVAAHSKEGDVRVTSTITWRHGLLELALGIVNNGPGDIHEIELLPTLSQEGLLDVVTVHGIEVDSEGRFLITQIEERRKAVATFLFRARTPMSVRMDCNLVYRRGIANIQEVHIQGRWLEVEGVEISPGEQVEPERVFELATQPAIFQDRCALYIPTGANPETLFDSCTDILERDLSSAVMLEDPDTNRIEAWFHGELRGGGSLVACLSISPKNGIIDIYTASTSAGVVPGAMLFLRKSVDRAAKKPLLDVMDRDLRTTISREGTLLIEGWGDIEEE